MPTPCTFEPPLPPSTVTPSIIEAWEARSRAAVRQLALGEYSRALAELGVDLLQGFFLARPEPYPVSEPPEHVQAFLCETMPSLDAATLPTVEGLIVPVEPVTPTTTIDRVLARLAEEIAEVVPVRNDGPHGYGRAVVAGLDAFTGDAVCVMMADESDSPEDAVLYWETLRLGWDCVFGSRFVEGSKVVDYPWFKLAINRLANQVIRRVFHIRCNDVTNAFKAYRREVVAGCRPFLSPHFNLTIEIPLKAVVRGYTWTVVPISWRNREAGESKLRLKEMGSRYFFICRHK